MAINKKHNSNSSGFALIFVLSFMALILTVFGDAIYQTQILAKNTMRSTNQIEAEAAAISGVSFAKLMINFHRIKENKDKTGAVQLEVPIYSLLNGMTIGKESLGAFASIAPQMPKLVQAFQKVKGDFMLNVTSENSKLNLNLLGDSTINFFDSTQNSATTVPIVMALCNIFSTPASKEVLRLYTLNGAPLNASTLVTNLANYIKSTTMDAQITCPNQSNPTPPGNTYTPKRGPLISIEELRRIPGFNFDDIYNMYAPYFTVWPMKIDTTDPTDLENSKININTVPIELLASMLPPLEDRITSPPLVWEAIDENRKATPAPVPESKTKPDIANFLLGPLKTNNKLPDNNWNFTPDQIKILNGLFSAKDSIFLIESRGMVNSVDKTLLVTVQPGKFPAGIGIGNTKNMKTIYTQWTTSPYPNLKPH